MLKAKYSQSSPFREPRYVGQVRRPELEERHRHPAPRGLRYETSDRGLALMESCLQVPPSPLLATAVTMTEELATNLHKDFTISISRLLTVFRRSFIIVF